VRNLKASFTALVAVILFSASQFFLAFGYKIDKVQLTLKITISYF